MGETTPKLLIRSKKFWKGFLIYYIISGTLFVILLFVLGLVAASTNISKDQTGAFSRILVFLFKYIFGFPVGFFLDYPSLKGFVSVLTLFLLQPLNSFIQWFIISYIRQRFRDNTIPG
ncbi:MAG TPA: hypothetical protein VGO58_16800 [Chitinophagaceae bacterium]|jgi:hypothetical protein|nr:hypothetical protein [Chitinophagaceae bacterium]